MLRSEASMRSRRAAWAAVGSAVVGVMPVRGSGLAARSVWYGQGAA